MPPRNLEPADSWRVDRGVRGGSAEEGGRRCVIARRRVTGLTTDHDRGHR